MNTNGKMTLEELAGRIGISRTTIYKILNNKGKVSEATRTKVLNAVRHYRYVPNLAAKSLALNRQYKVAFVGYQSPQAPYTLHNLLKGIQWAEREFGNFGLDISTVIIEADCCSRQADEIFRLSDQGFEGFAIYPSCIGPMGACIDAVAAQGKFVVTVNRDVPDSARHAFIGSSFYKSGILAAEVLARMVPPGQRIAVLLGGDGKEYPDVKARYEGLKKKMERFPAIELLPPYCPDTFSPDEGQGHHRLECSLDQYLTDLIQTQPDLGGILDITCDLDLAGRIVSRYNNSVRLVGFDLCDTVKNHMLHHSIDAVIFQDMVSQGYQAIQTLFQALSQEYSDPFQVPSTKLEVVYEGNLEFYMG